MGIRRGLFLDLMYWVLFMFVCLFLCRLFLDIIVFVMLRCNKTFFSAKFGVVWIDFYFF
jgi:hypothetical protein